MPYVVAIPQGSNVGLTRVSADRATALEASRAGVSSVNLNLFLDSASKSVLVGPSGNILIVSDNNYLVYLDEVYTAQLTGSVEFGSASYFTILTGITPGWHTVNLGTDTYFYLAFAI